MRVESVEILGVRVDDVTYDEAVDIIRGYVASGVPHHVMTTNTEHAVIARKDPEFKGVLNQAPLAVPDGSGLIWASRLLGRPLRQHVTGTDLAYRLMQLSAERGYRVFLLGAAEGVAEVAAERLRNRYPRLDVAGTYSGSPAREREDEAIARVRSAGRVDILLVAYGSPAQEKWIARNLARMGVPVAIGVGGVFDFFAGRVPRAPKWMRDLHLEWLFRLLIQPRRLRRQLALPYFVLLVLGTWLRGLVIPVLPRLPRLGKDRRPGALGDDQNQRHQDHRDAPEGD